VVSCKFIYVMRFMLLFLFRTSCSEKTFSPSYVGEGPEREGTPTSFFPPEVKNFVGFLELSYIFSAQFLSLKFPCTYSLSLFTKDFLPLACPPKFDYEWSFSGGFAVTSLGGGNDCASFRPTGESVFLRLSQGASVLLF